MLVSIVIRTYNEQKYLPELLNAISRQLTDDISVEILIVDSGSTDDTLDIAKSFNCKIVNIEKSMFSFGRSLNWGCRAASGEYLVFISGHCIPTDEFWLINLVTPLIESEVCFVYGKQVGGETTKFSEEILFQKFYPEESKVPQAGFFCNNANSALLKDVWEKFPFDESLTGLEDMHLAKQLVSQGYKVGYIASASVLHHHDEPWSTVKRRYEREAIALREIMPEVHLSISDFVRYWFSGVLLDSSIALEQKKLFSKLKEIVLFRLMQFWGSYRGNHEHRQISHKMKESYFYPPSKI